jgi:TRAP-type C4-dicarboxylate transport system permease small subunit
MKSLVSSVNRGFTRIESVFFSLSAGVLISIVLITCLDVGMRYFVRRPLVWSYPLTNTYLMPALFMFALATCARYHDHIAMDVVRLRMPPRVQRACELISDIAGFAVAFLIAIYGIFPLVQAWVDEERTPGDNWPLWPSYAIVPIGFGLLALRFLIQCAETLTKDEAVDVAPAEVRMEGFE